MTNRARVRIALRGLALGDAFGETWLSKPARFAERALAAALATQRIAGEELLDAVAGRTPDGEVRQGLDRAARLGLRASPHAAAAVLGCGQQVSAMDTVPFALWCAARHLDDLVEALWTAVTPGGDSDTIGAIVGGVVAAASGLDTVPPQWWAECEPLPAWVER